jgi:hypothetical protein
MIKDDNYIWKLKERMKAIELAKSVETDVIFKRKVPEGILNIKPAIKNRLASEKNKMVVMAEFQVPQFKSLKP